MLLVLWQRAATVDQLSFLRVVRAQRLRVRIFLGLAVVVRVCLARAATLLLVLLVLVGLVAAEAVPGPPQVRAAQDVSFSITEVLWLPTFIKTHLFLRHRSV